MNWRIGMYGGAFDPLHNGHLRCIREAAGMCGRLYIVLSYARARDHVPVEVRRQWLVRETASLANTQIILLEDTAASKAEYDREDYWEKGRDAVLSRIGGPVDVVFCGSDYRGTGRYERLYRCPVHYFDRSECDVSSTAIRSDPMRYRAYLPDSVKSFFEDAGRDQFD